MLQDVRSDGGSKRVSDDDNTVKVVESKDLRDRETGSLPVERGASYPIANWKYLMRSFKMRENAEIGCHYLYNNDTQVRVLLGELSYERDIG